MSWVCMTMYCARHRHFQMKWPKESLCGFFFTSSVCHWNDNRTLERHREIEFWQNIVQSRSILECYSMAQIIWLGQVPHFYQFQLIGEGGLTGKEYRDTLEWCEYISLSHTIWHDVSRMHVRYRWRERKKRHRKKWKGGPGKWWKYNEKECERRVRRKCWYEISKATINRIYRDQFRSYRMWMCMFHFSHSRSKGSTPKAIS